MNKVYLRYNDIGEEVRLLQRALNEKLNLRLKADGVFGKLTEEALRQYQRLHNLHVTGVYGQFEISLLGNFITAKYIREKDLELIALNNNLPISIVKAIKEVEARADGFLYDGRAVILFERHKFYRELVKESGTLRADTVASAYPDICNPERGGYRGYEQEYERMLRAAGISQEAAYKSCSYGLFQILGSNFREAGYVSVLDFFSDQQESEHKQLLSFMKFVRANSSLYMALKQRNYKRIAELYNGKKHQDNDYVKKLSLADARYVK